MTKSEDINNIFDRRALRRNRDRAGQNPGDHDFLLREAAMRLHEKYSEINRNFQTIVDLGARRGILGELMTGKQVIGQDLSGKFPGIHLRADEEFLPWRPASLDLVLSNLSLHAVNDLPGCLAQIRQALKPDGLFLCALFGGETLNELRSCLMEAEVKLHGGARPRISPFVDIRSAGALLQRAGFALPVAETDRITVTYENAFKLMQDIKNMGEGNILTKRFRGLTTARLMREMAKIYAEKFTDARGRITATFDIITLMGWAPHESQQQPLKPGQGKVSLTEVFGGKPEG